MSASLACDDMNNVGSHFFVDRNLKVVVCVNSLIKSSEDQTINCSLPSSVSVYSEQLGKCSGSVTDPSVKNSLTDLLSEFSSFENQRIYQIFTLSGKDYEKKNTIGKGSITLVSLTSMLCEVCRTSTN